MITLPNPKAFYCQFHEPCIDSTTYGRALTSAIKRDVDLGSVTIQTYNYAPHRYNSEFPIVRSAHEHAKLLKKAGLTRS